uniref:non-specific serine/threonine protein kinase n=1 Tax=Kalanchoe fedtschenkoi TaxID=63787 RepID=A0A7N0ZXA7_KALFE
MGFAGGNAVGKYQLVKLIGEGAFAKVKLAVDTVSGKYVAIKIIDKRVVVKNNLVLQVQREIRTMRLLNHPNIVKIYEVIGTKTKIYIVMEYVSGGQLSDKLSYAKRLGEDEARKIFQQLIDAVDYCHGRGVYHRDLKPENLLLDNKGNLKVSDFGLSALRKPGDLLSTACGSPCYVAPELVLNNKYDGSAADVWSCGVILFEMLSGSLPFNDPSLLNLYRKICGGRYTFPEWFSESQRKLISRILDPHSRTRITIGEIVEDEWFRTNYKPACGLECDENINLDDVQAAFGGIEESETGIKKPKSSSFINAFQLIAMSHDLDLSGLFKEKDEPEQRRTLGSENTFSETMKKIEAAANDVSLTVERTNNFKMKILPREKKSRCSRSYLNLSAEVIEVAPSHCVIEISKSAGELGFYKQFCNSLSSILAEPEKSSLSSLSQASTGESHVADSAESSPRVKLDENKPVHGYSSS